MAMPPPWCWRPPTSAPSRWCRLRRCASTPSTCPTTSAASDGLVVRVGSETGGLPVAARVARRQIPVGKAPDRLTAAELVVVVDHDEIVAAPTQLVDRCPREAVLDAHLHVLQPAEPRSVARRLRV